jgi:putative FmdB family regulatory protein
MPIYEFKCEMCQQEFEHLQKISDQSLPPCPNCHSLKVGRLVSAPGFQLKGSGWYATDFKESKKTANSTEVKQPVKQETKNND